MGHRAWMYRRGCSGQIESKLHPDHEQIPEDEGWVDTPAKLAAVKSDDAPNDPIKPRAAGKSRKTGHKRSKE